MNEILKKMVIALTAACAAAIGTSLGTLASDAIKARWGQPPDEEPEPEVKRRKPRKRKR